MWKSASDNIGEFVEQDFGKYFSYRHSDELTFGDDFPHEIAVLDGYRFAKVKKTVAYVIVDEDKDGQPVIEKWNIKNHKFYNS